HDEPAALHVGDQGLLAEEVIGPDDAVALDTQVLWNRLEALLLVHLAAQQQALGQKRPLAHPLHPHVVAPDLLPVQPPPPDSPPPLPAAVGAPAPPGGRPPERGAAAGAGARGGGDVPPPAEKPERLLHRPPVAAEKAEEPAEVIPVAVAQREQVDGAGVQAEHP